MAVNRRDPVRNLGHKASDDASLLKNPAKLGDYANNNVSKDIVRGPPRSTGVYGRFDDPKDGHDLSGWASYANKGSYHGSDPRGRGEGSDNHLASTKGWARFDAGAESGEGRLEKTRK